MSSGPLTVTGGQGTGSIPFIDSARMPPDRTIEPTYGVAADRARRLFEVPVLVAALLVVPVIFIEERSTSSLWLNAALVANWVIWALFFAEFAVVVTLADKRPQYAKRAWLDLLIIVVSFPLLPNAFAATRLLRLARLSRVLRLLRLLRLAAIVSRGGVAARAIFLKRGLGYLIVLVLLIALGVGGIFAIVEGSSVADGMWWAIVTVTTVGYGDMYPVTTAGRVAASVLMLLGIGLIAVITASVAAHIVGQEEKVNLHEELGHIGQRLDRLERLLSGTDPPSAPPERPGIDESA
jgi:voltage-gated potassium channel